MSYQIKPLGTTAETGWQHRLSRGESFGVWQDFDPEFEGFGTDPQTGTDITTGVTYWLYARNLALPPEEDGSAQQVLATAIVITPDGRVEALTPGGVLCESTSPATGNGFGDNVPVLVTNPQPGQVLGYGQAANGQVYAYNKDLPTPTLQIVTENLTDDEGVANTTIPSGFRGGLWLDEIPDATKELPALLWDAETKRVFKGTPVSTGGTTTPAVLTPVALSFGSHYETEAVSVTPPFTVPAGTPPLIGDSRYSGSLDLGTCDIVGGWAKKRDDLGATVQVDIYKNGVKHTTVLANESRPDVADAIGPGTNPYCGFHYDVQDADRTGIAITWAAKIADTSYELAKSPHTSNACGIVQTTIVRTFIDGPAELTEGGAVGNYVLKQERSNGTYTTVQPSQWSLSQNIPGITITTGSATGNLDPGVGSNVIANTITIGVRATLGSNIYEYPVRILNRDAANPPPTVNPFPDTVITATGAQTFSVASTFSDTDALTVQATTGVGYPLPAGITFNPANQSITVAADYPNGALAIVLTAVDTAGNSVQDAFLLTINRAVAPNITVVSTTIIGARFINEGSFSQYRLRRTYSNGQVSDISNIAYKSLEGWREGDNIDNEGNVRIPANTVAGDSRPLVVVMVAEGVRYTYDVNVVDISSVGEQNPAGTESCVNYARLTQAQFDALSQIVLYAYVDMQTPSGQLSYTARPFVSQAEATLLLPSKGQPGSVVGFNFHRVTQAGAPVGATVYNDSRADHILAGTAPYWPVQAGFYATNVTLPSGGNNGSYTLLQANACGVISVHTDNVPLIAN